MEIKVVCTCGTKYRFPVEPVNGMLPQSIACPSCGADNTALGNAAIQQQLAEAAPSQPAGSPGKLRIKAPSTAPSATAVADPPYAPPPIARHRTYAQPARASKGVGAKRVLTSIISGVLVLIGIWAIYHKIARRVHQAHDIIVSVAGKDDEGAHVRWTLLNDNGAQLLVKNSNHTNVAQALAAANVKLLRKPLKTEVEREDGNESEGTKFYVLPAFHDAVAVYGTWDWTEPVQEREAVAFAAELSKQLNTIVVMALMGDDADSGIYSVFENGERRFTLKRWPEFVQREGESWAKEHGYVADPDKLMTEDAKEVPFNDANELTMKLGIDVSDAPEMPDGTLVLVQKP